MLYLFSKESKFLRVMHQEDIHITPYTHSDSYTSSLWDQRAAIPRTIFTWKTRGLVVMLVVWEWVCGPCKVTVGRQSLFTQIFDAFLHLLPVCHAAIHPIIIRRFVRQYFVLLILFALYSSSHKCHTLSLLILICKNHSQLIESQRVHLRCLWYFYCSSCCNVSSCLHTKLEFQSQMGSNPTPQFR